MKFWFTSLQTPIVLKVRNHFSFRRYSAISSWSEERFWYNGGFTTTSSSSECPFELCHLSSEADASIIFLFIQLTYCALFSKFNFGLLPWTCTDLPTLNTILRIRNEKRLLFGKTVINIPRLKAILFGILTCGGKIEKASKITHFSY